MLIKPWGSQFTLNYYPRVDADVVNPPTQTPSIYVFAHNPSTADIDTGTNAIGVEITTWGETVDNLRTITIPAVADPGGSTKTKDYWVGIKYKLHASGTSTYDVQPFQLTRPDGHTAATLPTAEDLTERDSTLATYYSNTADIDDQIAAAQLNVRAWFAGRGMKWAQIENPEDLKEIIIYDALADLFVDLIKRPDDNFSIKAKHYREMTTTLREQLKIQYDADNNAEVADIEEDQSAGVIIFGR